MKVVVLITIDTECDKGKGWLIQKPLGFHGVEVGIDRILQPLFEKFEIKPTYLLSPEVMMNSASVDCLKGIINCELGTHLHGEFIDPDSLEIVERTSTPQFHYSPEVEQQKLNNLTELFKSKFNRPPWSFRAGRWGMSKYTLGFLEGLEYTVDSSICPFKTHYFSGDTAVNFWGAPVQPYHPSTSDFRKTGNRKILEVPASLGNSNLFKIPNFVLRQLSDKSKIHKKVLRRLNRSSGISWLRPLKSSPEELIQFSDTIINQYQENNRPVFLNMMFHNNEVIPGASPYVHSLSDQEYFINSISYWLDHLKSNYDAIGIGLSEVKENL